MNQKIIQGQMGQMLIIASLILSVLLLASCAPTPPPQANDASSTQQGIQEVANANNKFALEFYSQLGKSETGNMFYSPYSISSALAMTYEGAKGQTATEISSVFHFPESSILGPNFAAIYNGINNENNAYELRTGNALWVQQNYPLLQEYTTRVESFYGGKAANLDFINEAEKSRQTINAFIEEQTNDKIKDLIPAGILGPLTRLVLTNAIYFKGTWEWEFDKSDTREQDFKITPDNIVKVPTMYMNPEKARFNYADTEELQILELPYKGGNISMLIILPKENLDSIQSSLTAEKISEWKTKMQETKLDAIYLPKFEFDTKYSLRAVLSAMGMPTAFDDENADFSGMTSAEKLFISAVIHQAYVKVDEKGTEAAAATAVFMGATSMGPRDLIIFRADHPFIFIIQEKQTGNILFLGKVVDPTK
jgi:serpin B